MTFFDQKDNIIKTNQTEFWDNYGLDIISQIELQ